MIALSRPSTRILHLLGIIFAMLVLAYALNSVVEALLQQQLLVREVPDAARLAIPLDVYRLESQLGLSGWSATGSPCA